MRLSDIIKVFEAAFVQQYQNQLLPSHYKALAAMKMCRTEKSPLMLAACSKCDQKRYVPHSCGHRNCPHCQNHESQQWLERQLQKQVPAKYFMLTFTLPAEFRSLAWQHQRKVYSLLLKYSWETVQTFSQNDERLQGTPGATAVLHTHSRRLDFHPHVHLVMPAAAIDATKRLWRTKKSQDGKAEYLFNHTALAKVFRAKMLDALTREGLVLPVRHPKEWVADCKFVGSGDKALIYLGRYLYRGIIQEKDILACKRGRVTFRYQHSKTRQFELRTMPGPQFLWLLMKHVLPRSFRRARNYGFLHPNSKRLIGLLQYLLKLDPAHGLAALALIKRRTQLACKCCGAKMNIVRTQIPALSGKRVRVPT